MMAATLFLLVIAGVSLGTEATHNHTAWTSAATSLTRQRRTAAYDFDQRRITFPPGTTLILTPTLAIPFIRNLPTGFKSDMTISVPFTMSMDKLGWTDEANPWGIIPGLSQQRENSRSYQTHQRRYKRNPKQYQPHPLGDRTVMFAMIEDYLESLGHDGASCLRRAICEFHQYPLVYHGLFGEVLALLFDVSSAPFAQQMLTDYLTAEKTGREKNSCHSYAQNCPITMFSTNQEHTKRYQNIDLSALNQPWDHSSSSHNNVV